MEITIEQFARATECPMMRAERWHVPMTYAMVMFAINTPPRVAMFLANVAHESLGFFYAREVWGPTEAQNGYEGRKDLGNDMPGDGKRYMGRGPIQVTGRANYRAARDRLAAYYPNVPDFEREPAALEQPEWGARAAAEFWFRNKINAFADDNDFDGACDKVNRGRKTDRYGDANGFADRLRRYKVACAVLGVSV